MKSTYLIKLTIVHKNPITDPNKFEDKLDSIVGFSTASEAIAAGLSDSCPELKIEFVDLSLKYESGLTEKA